MARRNQRGFQIGLLVLTMASCSDDDTSPDSTQPTDPDVSAPQPPDSGRDPLTDSTPPPDSTGPMADARHGPDAHTLTDANADVAGPDDADLLGGDAVQPTADGATDADRPDGGGVEPVEGPVSCPDERFPACGGDLIGRWNLLDFCSHEGPAGAPRSCEGPGDGHPACQGGINRSACMLRYQGTADFAADGRLDVWFGVSMSIRYVFDDACLLSISHDTSPAEACAGFGTGRLQCIYTDGRCTCTADSEPEGEAGILAYEIDGNQIRVDGSAGTFCVEGDTATLQFDPFGPEGWRTWLLRR